jgi:3-methyladenine DNA glycosylase/8-oxoguanine DNA glycosylase
MALDVWNRKIIARHLWGIEEVKPEKLRKDMLRLFGKHAGIAVLYLTEYDFMDRT